MGGRTVVSDEEDDLDEEEEPRVVGKGGHGDEAEDDEEEEDEEEDGQDEYEKDGFIVDEEEEGEEEEKESDEERHKKKKKKKRESERNFELDEDDYELLQDNNITGINRPKPGNKFKRLKKAGRSSEAGERSGFSDEDKSDRNRASGHTAEEKLKRSLFGDDEGAQLEDIGEEEEQPEEEDADMIGEEDEMADFIVDEDEEDVEIDEETGEVVRRRRKPKQKKPRQAPGVSSTALMEAQEIFGDVDELLSRRKQDLERDDTSRFAPKQIEDEFEPFILSEKYMTAKDDIIRETDVPERLQLIEELTGPPPIDDQSIAEESAWIHTQFLNDSLVSSSYSDEVVRAVTKEDIGNVLTMLHVHRLDVPFIATYRKELCGSLLEDPDMNSSEKPEKMRWHKLLWAVFNLDKKWLLLRKRKMALDTYYQRRFEEEFRRVDDETRIARNRLLFNSISQALAEAKSEREVDDVDAKFNLHFPPGEADIEEGQFKRPKRKSLYSICYKAGLWEVANKFGYSAEQFGQLLTLAKLSAEIGDVEDIKETPEEIAATFTCAMFEKPQDVLKGARHMAAVEIGCEPIVRKHVRGIFLEHGVVCTSPTPEGIQTIDQHHELAGVKWLQKKPISKFDDSQWLLIQKGEEEKLLQVTIKLTKEAQDRLMSEASEFYLSDRVSKTAQLWNEQRKMILEDAFSSILLPSMEKEARSVLTARAKSYLLMEYGKQLWSKVTVAPWRGKDNSRNELEVKVMACCWGPGRPATTFVALDPAGEMVDVLYAGSICNRSQGVTEQQKKKNDEQRVIRFALEHKPDAVCVGAANLMCKGLKDDIYEVIFKIIEDHPKDVNEDCMNIVLCDESLPRLYENSRVASDQVPSQQGIVKRAVALGRYLQNPLAMIATLCGPGREILSWKLCPLEQFLTPDEKFEMVEQIMVDATNQIGIDVNLASSHEWLFAPLQFVAGLGPRKATGLQKAFVRAGSVVSRKEISGFLRKKVFYNCIGFLRVCRTGAAGSALAVDVLDDTRIHPESYELAGDMAKDVYAEDIAQDANELDEDEAMMAIELVKTKKPHMLEALNIDEYMKSLPESKSKRETLYDIKMELLHGFQDWRAPFRDPTSEEEFLMLSGETDESIAEGRTVQVSVRAVQDNRYVCGFDSGLKAFIMFEDFEGYDPDPERQQVREGDIITARIKNVNKARCLVYLTTKEDMRRRHYVKLDPYYHENDVSSRTEREKAQKKKELAKKHFKPRMIVHPRFQNLTADEAIELLSDKDPGESIIRPSSKGPSFLTLTLKISDGVYAHKEIVESNKDHKDIASLLRLGKTLTIDKDTFEDLDEVMDRYVDPLVGHLKNMLAYRKFRKGTKSEIDDQLRAEKVDNPMRILYAVSISHEHPGTFILTYIRSSNPHHEYIGLFPKGFRFRQRDFEDIDRLVSYFQKNIDKPPPNPVMSVRSVAALVPMNPDRGNGSDGGWRSDRGGRGGRYDSRDSDGRDGFGGRGRGRGRGQGRGRGRDSDFGSDRNHESGSSRWSSGSRNNNGEGSESWGGTGGGDRWGSGGNDHGRRDSGGGSWGGGGGGGSRGGGGNGGGSSWGDGGSGGDWGGTEQSQKLVPPQSDAGGWGGGSDGGW